MIRSNFVGLASINLKHCHLLIYNDSLMSVVASQAKNFLNDNVNWKCFQDFCGGRYFAGTFDRRLVKDPHALALLAFQHLPATVQATTFTQRFVRQVFHTVQLRRMVGAL